MRSRGARRCTIAYAIKSQIETKEQFETALDEFRSVVEFDGGELETAYEKLNTEYQRSQNKANSFRQQIDVLNNCLWRSLF